MYLETLALFLTRRLELQQCYTAMSYARWQYIFTPDGVKTIPLNDEPDAQWLNLATVLGYYDTFENLVVRGSLKPF